MEPPAANHKITARQTFDLRPGQECAEARCPASPVTRLAIQASRGLLV